MRDDRPNGTGAPAPLNVLLVDDDDGLRDALSQGLRARGFMVTAAGTAAEAMASIADPAIAIDVLVMDLVLPDSWGPQVAMERTLYRPAVPVVYISGYSNEDAIISASAAGQNAPFLQKPFSVAQLADAIRAVTSEEGGDSPTD